MAAIVDEAFEALEREISVLLRRTRANSADIARQLHPGLEPGAYGLLLRLDQVGAQRPSDLAGYFGIGKPTISRQLRALEQHGLVSREPDPADGRAHLVRLTEEGRRRFTTVRDARRARYLELMEAWDRGEISELARLLHRLNEDMKDDSTAREPRTTAPSVRTGGKDGPESGPPPGPDSGAQDADLPAADRPDPERQPGERTPGEHPDTGHPAPEGAEGTGRRDAGPADSGRS